MACGWAVQWNRPISLCINFLGPSTVTRLGGPTINIDKMSLPYMTQQPWLTVRALVVVTTHHNALTYQLYDQYVRNISYCQTLYPDVIHFRIFHEKRTNKHVF